MSSTFTYSDASTSSSNDTTITTSSYSIPSGQTLVSVDIGADVTIIGSTAFQTDSVRASLTTVTFENKETITIE